MKRKEQIVKSVKSSISKSIFASVQSFSDFPIVLMSSTVDPFTGLTSSFLDGTAPYQEVVSSKYYLVDKAGSRDALVRVPCLRNNVTSNQYVDLSSLSLSLTANFEISFWIKYEGSNITGSGPMIFGGGDSTLGSAYRAYLWYRPSTGIWYLAIDGESLKLQSTANAVLEDNNWHFIQVIRTGTLYSLYVDGVLIVSATNTVGTLTIRRIMQTYSPNYSLHGMMANFVVNNAGTITEIPLQDGVGDGTNRDIAWYKSDGTSGVISSAITNGTVSSWWAAYTDGQVADWSLEYGGKLASNGAFVLGNKANGNCADGNAKTFTEGKIGNPFTQINFNPSMDDDLQARAFPTAFHKTQQLNDYLAPFDSAFNRVSADGTDRILIYDTAATGAKLAVIRSYVGISAPIVWTLDDLPDELADKYFAAITSNSGTISSDNQTAVRNLMNGLQQEGLFKEICCLYLFHGNHLNAARLNAVNPTLLDGSGVITWSGSPTLDASGGITPSSGNYGIGPNPHSLGLTQFTAFSGAGLGFYSTSNAATSEYTIGNIVDFYLAPKHSGVSEVAVSNSAVTGIAQDLSGFHFCTRESDSAQEKAYRNGVKYIDFTRDFNQILTVINDTGRLHIGGCSNNGLGNLASTTPIRLALITRGILEAKVAALNTLVQTYISELV